MSSLVPVLTIRAASADDAAHVTRLAALDSAAVPRGPLLLGLVDGVPLAAMSRSTGALVADPFSPTAELVELLRRRTALLRAPRPQRRRRWRSLHAGGVAAAR